MVKLIYAWRCSPLQIYGNNQEECGHAAGRLSRWAFSTAASRARRRDRPRCGAGGKGHVFAPVYLYTLHACVAAAIPPGKTTGMRSSTESKKDIIKCWKNGVSVLCCPRFFEFKDMSRPCNFVDEVRLVRETDNARSGLLRDTTSGSGTVASDRCEGNGALGDQRKRGALALECRAGGYLKGGTGQLDPHPPDSRGRRRRNCGGMLVARGVQTMIFTVVPRVKQLGARSIPHDQPAHTLPGLCKNQIRRICVRRRGGREAVSGRYQ